MKSEAKEFLDTIDFMPFIRSHNYGIGISRYEFFGFLWSDVIDYWHENNIDDENAKCPYFSPDGLKCYLICRYGDGEHVSSFCKDERDQFQQEQQRAFDFLNTIDFIPYFEKYRDLNYFEFDNKIFDDTYELYKDSCKDIKFYVLDKWRLSQYLKRRYGDYYFNYCMHRKLEILL